jgi:hypothetical protein
MWWGTRKNPTERMKIEIQKMQGLFNVKVPTPINFGVDWDVPFLLETLQLSLNLDHPKRPYWLITFRMHLDPKAPWGRAESRDAFTIKIEYHPRHPYQEPIVTVESHDVLGHQYSDGRLCLFDHSGVRSSGWDPAKNTAASMGLWSVQWIRAWLYEKEIGYWPRAS